ncbi:MAG: recombinase family protein [Nibricoccus sp.]
MKHWREIDPNELVVIYCRASTYAQDWRGTLDKQSRNLRRILRRAGFRVVAIYRERESGWRDDRDGLAAAVQHAKRVGAVLMVESTARLLRSAFYDPVHHPDQQPLRGEWELLADELRGVTAATIVHPDASQDQIRAYETKRGFLRPVRSGELKDRRQNLEAHFLKLVRVGASQRDLEMELGVPRSTVRGWLQLLKNRGGRIFAPSREKEAKG